MATKGIPPPDMGTVLLMLPLIIATAPISIPLILLGTPFAVIAKK